MAPVWKSYTREIYRSLHYLAAWPPTRTLAVGDIVVFEGRSPERQLSLTDLGYDFEVRSDPDLRNRGWASNGSVRAEPMAEASSPVHPGVKVGLGLKLVFEDKHRFLLRAERSREQTMERLDQVNDEIFRLHDEGKWRREWRLITHVIQAEKTMVLLSEGRNVSADLEVSADIGLDPLSVARGQGAVKLLRSSAGLNYEAGDNVTPLYQARRIKTLFGRGTKQVGKRGRARAGLGELHVVEEEF
jgi:hypothetical protein